MSYSIDTTTLWFPDGRFDLDGALNAVDLTDWSDARLFEMDHAGLELAVEELAGAIDACDRPNGRPEPADSWTQLKPAIESTLEQTRSFLAANTAADIGSAGAAQAARVLLATLATACTTDSFATWHNGVEAFEVAGGGVIRTWAAHSSGDLAHVGASAAALLVGVPEFLSVLAAGGAYAPSSWSLTCIR